MNKRELFKALRQHRKLSEQRTFDFEKNKAAKYIMYFVTALMMIYLLMFAVSFALIANSLRTMSSIEFICSMAPMIIVVDFFVRFMGQQTPSQIIKPYVLLPIPKYTCIDFFLTGQMLNSSNLIWFVMLVPYCLMSVLFSYGFWSCVGLLLFFWLLELCISQFYLIVRTLVTDTMLWWIMPAMVALIGVMPCIQWENLSLIMSSPSLLFDFDKLVDFYANFGTGIEEGHLWPYLVLLALLTVLFFINRKLQYSHVMKEVSRVEKITTIKNPSEMKFLNRFGELGLFLGLEIRTSMRNKNPRKAMISAIVLTVMFSLIIIFTEVYDSMYMANFWCVYCYAIFSIMTLVKIMANEGNYIDGLMVRKENILQILKAKYIFNCLILILPFILMLPQVFSGKWSFLMVASLGVFTAGFQLFLLFQLAVSNKQSQPLNTKFVSKNGIENSKWQFIVEMICMLVPVVAVSLLNITLGDIWGYVIMFLIGVVFIATSNIWLRNIYNRFMKRRYLNMEGFRASR